MRALPLVLVLLGGCDACREVAAGFKEGWNEGICEEGSKTAADCSSCCERASAAEGRFTSGRCACVNAGGN